MARIPRAKSRYKRNPLNFKDSTKTTSAAENIKRPYQLNGINGDLGSKSNDINPSKMPPETKQM